MSLVKVVLSSLIIRLVFSYVIPEVADTVISNDTGDLSPTRIKLLSFEDVNENENQDCNGDDCNKRKTTKIIITETNPCLNIDITVPVIGRVNCKNTNLCNRIQCHQTIKSEITPLLPQPQPQNQFTFPESGFDDSFLPTLDEDPSRRFFDPENVNLNDDDIADAYAVEKVRHDWQKKRNFEVSTRMLEQSVYNPFSEETETQQPDRCKGKPVCCELEPAPNENKCQRDLVCCSDWKTPCVESPKHSDKLSAMANLHFCDQTVHWQLNLYRDSSSQHGQKRECVERCGICDHQELPPPNGLQRRWDFYATVSEISQTSENDWLVVLCNISMYIEAFDIHDPSQAVTHLPLDCYGVPVDENDKPLLNHSIYVITDPNTQPQYTRYDVSHSKCSSQWTGCPLTGCQCVTFMVQFNSGCSGITFPTPLRPNLCSTPLVDPLGFAIESFHKDDCECVCKITKPPLVPINPHCQNDQCSRPPQAPVVFIDIGRNYNPKRWEDLGTCASIDPYRYWPRLNTMSASDHLFPKWIAQSITLSKSQLSNIFRPNTQHPGKGHYNFRDVTLPQLIQFSPLRNNGVVDWVGYAFEGSIDGYSVYLPNDPSENQDNEMNDDQSLSSSSSQHGMYPKCMKYSIRKKVSTLEKTCKRYTPNESRNPIQLFQHEHRVMYDGTFTDTVRFWVSVNVIQNGNEWDCLKQEKYFCFTYREGCETPIQRLEMASPKAEVHSVLQPIVLIDNAEESQCSTSEGRFLLTWKVEIVQPYPGATIGIWNRDQIRIINGGQQSPLSDQQSCFRFTLSEDSVMTTPMTLEAKWDRYSPGNTEYEYNSNVDCSKMVHDIQKSRKDPNDNPAYVKCMLCNRCHSGLDGMCNNLENYADIDDCISRCQQALPDICYWPSTTLSSTPTISQSSGATPSRNIWIEPPQCDKYADVKGVCVQFIEILTNCHDLDSRFYSQCLSNGHELDPISIELSPSISNESPLSVSGTNRLQELSQCNGDCSGDNGCRDRCRDDHDNKGKIGPIYIHIQNNITINNCVKIEKSKCKERSGWHCWNCDKRPDRPGKCCPDKKCDSCCKDMCCDNWVKPRDSWSDDKNHNGGSGGDSFTWSEQCDGGEGEAEGEAQRGRFDGVDNDRRRCKKYDQWGKCCEYDDHNTCEDNWVWLWIPFVVIILILICCCALYYGYDYDVPVSQSYGVVAVPPKTHSTTTYQSQNDRHTSTSKTGPSQLSQSGFNIFAGDGKAAVSANNTNIKLPSQYNDKSHSFNQDQLANSQWTSPTMRSVAAYPYAYPVTPDTQQPYVYQQPYLYLHPTGHAPIIYNNDYNNGFVSGNASIDDFEDTGSSAANRHVQEKITASETKRLQNAKSKKKPKKGKNEQFFSS